MGVSMRIKKMGYVENFSPGNEVSSISRGRSKCFCCCNWDSRVNILNQNLICPINPRVERHPCLMHLQLWRIHSCYNLEIHIISCINLCAIISSYFVCANCCQTTVIDCQRRLKTILNLYDIHYLADTIPTAAHVESKPY